MPDCAIGSEGKNGFILRYPVFYSGAVVTEFFSSVFVQIWSDLGKQSEFKKAETWDLLKFPSKKISNKIKDLQKSQIKKKGPQTADLNLFDGAPGRIRTHDPLVRSQVLYPTELLAHI